MTYRVSWFKPGFQTRLAITCNCLQAFFLFGYDQGVFGGLISNPSFLDVVGHPSLPFLGFIVSSYNLGCFSGCGLNFMIGSRWGRRHALWLALLLVITGAVLQSSAYSVPQLITGRIVTGLGVGIDTSTIPTYQAELCKPHVRGRLVTTEVSFACLGVAFAYFFAYGINFAGGEIAWRLPIAIQIVPAIVISIVLFGLPETPRWLMEQGRINEAVAVMCHVYGVDSDDYQIQEEKAAIIHALEIENADPFRWTNVFKKDRLHTGRRVILAILALSANQLAGINVIVVYIATVLETNIGLSRDQALIGGGGINFAFVIGSLVPAFGIDRIGRRKPMVIGAIGMALSLLAISVLLSYKGTDKEKPTANAAIGFFVLYQLSFGASLNGVPWCYGAEILPLKARVKGTSLAVLANWVWVFIIVEVTPILIDRLQWRMYLIFMTTNILMALMIYFLFPETSRLSLEEIDMIFVIDDDPLSLPQDVSEKSSQSKAGDERVLV
ncbi:putative Myo-inositol transporter 1 [Xylaria curta]|nr:putative Myo-inositol transporter 1 [Xylaria curta]